MFRSVEQMTLDMRNKEIDRLRELLRQAHEILSTALDVIAAHVPEAPIRERIEAELDKIGGE
jgi:hypothetical protein